MKKVIAVIVNWNNYEDTLVCLNSLKQLNISGYRFSVIIVDNGSTNNSAILIKKAHPWVDLIKTKKNLGYSGGNNIGIRTALNQGADCIWLLNNDTVAEINALTALNNFQDETVGLVGCKIYFAAGHEYHRDRYKPNERGRVIWFAGGVVDWLNMYTSHRGVDQIDYGQYNLVEQTSFITGCSMFVRSEVLQKIGMLDEKFYLYLEDFDFCQRARAAGYKLIYDPNSIIWHVNAGSSGGAGNPMHEYYLTRNRLLIGMRYAPLRTKIALFREGWKFVFSGSLIKRKAVFDALRQRWGNQYEPRKF